ncbi:MAG: hypothetical protein JSU96_19620 [Acidobacteriota bacterium]|nr:MAG: hypothetical protein JSU96_19620 [Acidobacteriota bacterium]
MFLSLLLTTFLIALGVSTVIALVFKPALNRILERILMDPIYSSWVRYLMFAIYVVGISSGVRIWDLEKYITPRTGAGTTLEPLVLNTERWVLEVYRTVIGTLQGAAWLLLVFFVFALIGFIVVKLGESRTEKT